LSDFGNNKVYEQGVFILVLEVNNLQKSFATGFLGTKVSVLRGVSFNVREGAVVGFIGANGAGKKSLILIYLKKLVFYQSAQTFISF